MKRFLLLLIVIPLVVGCKQDTAKEFVNEITCYSDFSTIDWVALSNKHKRPNAADWDLATNNQIISSFPMEIALEFWNLLRSVRTDFHQKSLPLRAEASENIITALDRTEAMFDTVFVRCVSQEYYMRLFPEMYNETMKPAIDELVIELANKQP